MIIVSNTSPLNYLVLIGVQQILPALFGKIVIPCAVCEELGDALVPETVQCWIAKKPEWLIVQQASPNNDARLKLLHRGEREAVSLAIELNADLIILDERPARRIAEACHLHVTGTLGILNFAGQRRLLNIPQAVERLKKTSFRASLAMYRWLLDQFIG